MKGAISLQAGWLLPEAGVRKVISGGALWALHALVSAAGDCAPCPRPISLLAQSSENGCPHNTAAAALARLDIHAAQGHRRALVLGETHAPRVDICNFDA